MQSAARNLFDYHTTPLVVTHVGAGSSRRQETESFIRTIFARRYGADVTAFAPNLMLFEQNQRAIAATGWRPAQNETLFLERYLDLPIEAAMAQLAGQPVQRERIAEVGNLAAEKHGSSIQVIVTLSEHLHRLGHEWVVFTATQELIGIFSRLGIPLLALAPADPSRLGDGARDWGRYYDTKPIVVAGKIRIALERAGRLA
jgi:hypothetical protein